MRRYLLIIVLLYPVCIFAQVLNIRDREPDALSGSQFSASISDSAMSLIQREKIIYKAIKKGMSRGFTGNL